MRRFTQMLLLAVCMLAFAAVANAQATRTWVSGVGDDVNPCSRTAPCKTFAGAISKTAANGEINCLDPGGFGAVTITKSIKIDCATIGEGGIASSGGVNGVNINDASSATPNTSQVILRNLEINGMGTGADGIRALAFRRVIIDNVVVLGVTGDGLEILPNAANTFNVTVVNSSFIRNGTGIRQGVTAGTLNASYNNVRLIGNIGDGFVATGGTGNISDSLVDSNGANGINVSGGAVVNADENNVTNNITNGFNCVSPSSIRYNGNNVHRNATGIAGNGTHQTFANNKVIGNTTADVGAGVVFTNVTAGNIK